jgi:TolB-like protein/Flp pilus assembly protein TadD
MNPKSFFGELRRRNVYKVAVAYAVVAWLLIQIATQVFPFFEIPNWGVRLIVLAIISGFPIALVLAWAFELTPEGIKRTEDVDLAKEHSHRSAWIYIVAVSMALSVSLFFVGRYTAGMTRRSEVPTVLQKSIAVLPFENLSDDKSNAYFAEGIQEEVLTHLARIAELKIISRTSTQQYQSKGRNLREIAKQLGVANILEGSVQKAADQVRVNVQLINALTDSHVWADTYDRKLTDIFEVESEIAKGIAESLQAKLTGPEKQALAIKPTNNPKAYDAYLRGVAFEARGLYPTAIPDLLSKAISFYEQAVQLDPNFAVAWARLSRVWAFKYFGGLGPNHGAPGDAAKNALDSAQRLEPNSPETLLALGYYQYWVLKDYAAAKTTFERVIKILPGSSEVLEALGRIVQREGHWDQSVAYHEKALAVDPRNAELLMDTAWTYSMLRQFPAVLKLYDRALDITPNNPDILAFKAGVYQAQGNLQEAASWLSKIHSEIPSETVIQIKVAQLTFERRFDEAIRLQQARLNQVRVGFELETAFDKLRLAFTQRLAGDSAGAKITAEQARNAFQEVYAEQPETAGRAAQLSQAYAAMGEKDLALQEAQRAITLSLGDKDAVDGPSAAENLALIQTMVGDYSPAVATLTQLLHKPYNTWVNPQTPITPALLRFDPVWDPLRSDPAFQKLCEEKSK